jgi:hypothetical protein
MKPLPLVIAIACFVLAVLYGIGVLQVATSNPGPGRHHTTHFVLFVVLGLLALAWGRFAAVGAKATGR